MQAEILSTGNEIICGSIVDTNTVYIANSLEENGVKVIRHTCVGDSLLKLSNIIDEISHRSELAIVSGGLGPTKDDITTEAVSKVIGEKNQLNKDALKNIISFFKKNCISINKSDYKQALLPKKAVCLHNNIGSAPGFLISIKKCDFFFIPGVPSEAKSMLKEEVIPRIIKMNKNIVYKKIKTLSFFGLSESILGEKLSNFETKFPKIKLGICVVFPQIQIKLYIKEKNLISCHYQTKTALKWIVSRVGNYLISYNDEKMAAIVGGILKKNKATLALAESCTGGLIANLLTDISGSSAYFIFSAITYSSLAKINVLGLNSKIINKYGEIHEKIAEEMAIKVKNSVNATYGLSTTGIADSNITNNIITKIKSGTIFIGLATPNSSKAYKFNFNFNDRVKNKEMFAITALNILRKELLSSNNNN